MHIEGEAPSVRGSAADLERLLHALLHNAIEAAAQSPAPASGPRVVARLGTVGAEIEVVIEDSGPGIPASVLPRLFEPFFTTKEVGRGMGLGLSAAYAIARRHGGRITAENRAEGGARLRVTLPGMGPEAATDNPA